MRGLASLPGGLAIVLTAGVLAQAVLRAQAGPLPLLGVFETHLLALAAVAAVVAIPAALGGGRGRAWLRLGLVAVLVVAVVRLGDELWSPGSPGTPGSGVEAQAGGAPEPGAGDARLRVLSWNLEQQSKGAAEAVAGIAAVDADVVALQELTPAYAAAIEADGGLLGAYPYRILEPDDGAGGLGVLARDPLLVRGVDDRARVLRAGLLLPDGRTAELLVVHAPAPPVASTLSIAHGLDTRRRDAAFGRIRELVDGLDEPAGAIVLGDFNASPSEAGLDVLDEGLVDAHLAVGSGPGFTWRPDALEATGFALLRIDAVRTGAWFTPLETEVDCAAAGDHCRLVAMLRVEAAGD